MEDSPRLSKAVRSLIKVKDLLVQFLKCEVGNGRTALFWFDSWNDLGPLLTFIGCWASSTSSKAYCFNSGRNKKWSVEPAFCKEPTN